LPRRAVGRLTGVAMISASSTPTVVPSCLVQMKSGGSGPRSWLEGLSPVTAR
jgi:hypothetical protein